MVLCASLLKPKRWCQNQFKKTEGRNFSFDLAFSDGGSFGTLRSEVASSIMTANVSDPQSGTGSQNNSNTGSGGGHPPQLPLTSPPQPVSTLQHNYSNIQAPIPTTSNNGSLTSSRTHSSNASPFNGVTLPQPPLGPPPPVPSNSEGGGAFSRSAVRPRTPTEERVKRREKMAIDEAKKSRLSEVADLIHLEPPLTEDLVIRTLQARFYNEKYFVSIKILRDFWMLCVAANFVTLWSQIQDLRLLRARV